RVAVFLGALGDRLELVGGHAAEGNLDALHPRGIPFGIGPLGQALLREAEILRHNAIVTATVVVALSVGAAPQAHLGEHAFLDLALLAQLHLVFERVDLVAPLGGDPVLELLAPARLFHRLFSCAGRRPYRITNDFGPARRRCVLSFCIRAGAKSPAETSRAPLLGVIPRCCQRRVQRLATRSTPHSASTAKRPGRRWRTGSPVFPCSHRSSGRTRGRAPAPWHSTRMSAPPARWIS